MASLTLYEHGVEPEYSVPLYEEMKKYKQKNKVREQWNLDCPACFTE